MITQTGEYALRAMVHLAANGPQRPMPAAEISEATQVPVGYLQKILRMLTRAGILTAQRGSGGGFALAKVPTAISVLDVLNATESGISRIERCPLGIEGHTRLCALHHLLDDQVARAERAFAMTSLASLLDEVTGVSPLCPIPGARSRGKRPA